MRYVGICGSDLHYYSTGRIGDQVVTEPFILGHEGSGELKEEVGGLPPGTPIYVEPAVSCHQCDQCLSGRENTCRRLKFLGNPLELSGCMCDEIAMPAECVIPIPAWMSLEVAVLLEPLCIGVYAVARSRAGRGVTAAVVGAGPIGLSVLLGLSNVGPSMVLVSEPVEARRLTAEKLGAARTFSPPAEGAAGEVVEASQGGVDVSYECAGTQESIDDAASMLKPGGTLVLLGIPEGTDRVTYDPHLMRRREITLINIRRQNKSLADALAVLERRRDAAKLLITHRFPAVKAEEAFELVRQRRDNAIKVLLEFGESV
jgi:L-iditol 2-dehydrogenase